MERYDIFGIGAALVDTEIRVTAADLQFLGIAPGVMTLIDAPRMEKIIARLREHIDSATRACGGSAANSLIAASYFGCRSFFTCRVADDADGHFFLGDLARAGIDYNTAGQKVAGVTGKCLVMVTPDAERSMNTCLSVSADLDRTSLQADAIRHSRLVYLEGYLATSESGRDAATEARHIAHDSGAIVAASLSDPALVEYCRAPLQAMIGERLDLLFCNEAEALGWTGTTQIEAALAKLREQTERGAITLGSRGALMYDDKEQWLVPAPAAEAMDTNGAGDIFAGTCMAALLGGHSLAEAGRRACRAAAAVVGKFGPRLDPEQYRELSREFDQSRDWMRSDSGIGLSTK